MESQLVVVRHGQTEWSRTGRHTGRTDIDLTEEGQAEATRAGVALRPWGFAERFVSPLRRATQTAQLIQMARPYAGDEPVTFDDDLMEWDYGTYEGRTNEAITAEEPGWSKWQGTLAEGESANDVGQRADRAIARMANAAVAGPVLVVAHGHLCSILIARWLGLDAADGRLFPLATATISVLGEKRGGRVLRLLNRSCDESSEIQPA